MQCYVSRDASIKSLVSIGFPVGVAESIYDQSDADGKIQGLQDYINLKLSMSEKDETVPLRDI